MTSILILAIAATPLVIANLLLAVVSTVMSMIVMRFAVPTILRRAVPRTMAIIVTISCHISAGGSPDDRANHRAALTVVAVANH